MPKGGRKFSLHFWLPFEIRIEKLQKDGMRQDLKTGKKWIGI